MEFERTSIPDVMLIRPRVLQDARGHFFESWQERTFAAAGLDVRFRQENETMSVRSVLRGIHYQLHRPQGKLIRVVTGTILDVAVDLRRSSRTFGSWVATELTHINRHMLWIPAGFGHGFVVLSESAQVLYKCTEFHVPHDEHAIVWNDADLKIDWRLPAGIQPILSERDRAAGSFRDAEYFP
jgi:dTDP-4-dehydrorhamnose 3,5-epimerase